MFWLARRSASTSLVRLLGGEAEPAQRGDHFLCRGPDLGDPRRLLRPL
jgi:hypothetical protein